MCLAEQIEHEILAVSVPEQQLVDLGGNLIKETVCQILHKLEEHQIAFNTFSLSSFEDLDVYVSKFDTSGRIRLRTYVDTDEDW